MDLVSIQAALHPASDNKTTVIKNGGALYITI